MKSKILILFFSFMISNESFAWGFKGHHLVTAIAWRNLNETAKSKIKSLGWEKEDFITSGSWADEVRTDVTYSYLKPWHFVDFQNGYQFVTTPLVIHPKKNSTTSPDKGDVLQALVLQKEILINPSSSNEAKTLALRLMNHFVGDIHMPLHVGKHEDKGGNDEIVKIYGQTSRTYGNKTYTSNLHGAWDGDVVNNILRKYGATQESLDGKNITMSDVISIAEKMADLPYKPNDSENYLLWADESQAFHPIAYSFGTNRDLDQAYFDRVLPFAEVRLQLAGLRLARELNESFAEDAKLSSSFIAFKTLLLEMCQKAGDKNNCLDELQKK